MLRAAITPEALHARQEGTLPGRFGFVVTRLEEGRLDAKVELQPWMLASRSFAIQLILS